MDFGAGGEGHRAHNSLTSAFTFGEDLTISHDHHGRWLASTGPESLCGRGGLKYISTLDVYCPDIYSGVNALRGLFDRPPLLRMTENDGP